MSSTEQFTRACTQCRELIAQQLEAREQLRRALAHSAGEEEVAVLREKIRKLTASTESEFLKAMATLPTSRS